MTKTYEEILERAEQAYLDEESCNPVLLNDVALMACGITIEEAHKKGICMNCKEPAMPKCYSQDGINEYQISGICEQCFDELFEE